ncbi:MAG: DUF3990 domain-containing protein [Muribaculaceae bacterium]|nr:DUF3990 domain-containing protein [Muribaculaceae bacterium]
MIKKLFHGSNVAITSIDLSMSLIDKDFGKGFYLTDIESQAVAMAQRRVRIMSHGEPIVTVFEFDDSCLANSDLNVKVFPDVVNAEWAEFVNANRNSSQTGFTHPFDIVIGPVADDGVAYQLERYNEGVIDIKTLARELAYRKLNRQYFFGTEKAIAQLKQ